MTVGGEQDVGIRERESALSPTPFSRETIKETSRGGANRAKVGRIRNGTGPKGGTKKREGTQGIGSGGQKENGGSYFGQGTEPNIKKGDVIR